MFAMLKKMDYVQATENTISRCVVSCEVCDNKSGAEKVEKRGPAERNPSKRNRNQAQNWNPMGVRPTQFTDTFV